MSGHGHELADGSWSSEYKIGDKFEVVSYEVSGRIPSDLFTVGQVVVFEYDDYTSCPRFKALNGDDSTYEDWACLKPYKEITEVSSKQFTKSDLLDGMICTNRCGYIYTVQGDRMVRDGGCYIGLNYLREDLTVVSGTSDLDIMQVAQPIVLFTRQEVPAKSPAQIELDKLQEQIAQLQQQADKLQQSL